MIKIPPKPTVLPVTEQNKYTQKVETFFENFNNSPTPVKPTIQQITDAFLNIKPDIFGVEGLYNKNDAPVLGSLIPRYETTTQYNFYTDVYEDVFKSEPSSIEAALPCLYVIGDKQNYNKQLYKNIITVLGEIPLEPENINKIYEYYDEVGKLYNKSKLSLNNNLRQKFNSVLLKQSQVYFTAQGVNRFTEINENKNLLPFYNTIQFSTDKTSEITNVLESSNFIDNFCKFIINSKFKEINLNILSSQYVNDSLQQSVNTESIPVLEFGTVEDFFKNLKTVLLDQTNITSYGNTKTENSGPISNAIKLNLVINKLMTIFKQKIKTPEQFVNGEISNADLVMYELEKIPENGTFPVQKIYLPNLSSVENIIYNDSQVKFGKIYQYKLNGYYFSLKQIINPLIIQQIITGNTSARGRVVAIGQPAGGTTTQNTVPADSQQQEELEQLTSFSGFNNFNFGSIEQIFTSQTREIQARDLCGNLQDIETETSTFIAPVIGTQESTEAILDLNTTTPQQFFNFIIEQLNLYLQNNIDPFIYAPFVFKRQIITDLLAVYDKPPPPPDLEIDGMIGVDSKILIRLNKGISEFKQAPIIIQPEDRDIFYKNLLFQKLNSFEDRLFFDGDDDISHFQIFRIESLPSSYEQFRDNYVTASTFISEPNSDSFVTQVGLKSNHSSYIDQIEPNKKYYYIFRTVDIHGNISNPTPIYEIEMVNSDGTIYPIIKIVELFKEDKKQPSKQARRFLYIAPNALQSLINEKETGYFDENGDIKESADIVKNQVKLGLSEQRMWNKNYRLKIRSKLTGKLVEIDFKFTHKTIQNNN